MTVGTYDGVIHNRQNSRVASSAIPAAHSVVGDLAAEVPLNGEVDDHGPSGDSNEDGDCHQDAFQHFLAFLLFAYIERLSG